MMDLFSSTVDLDKLLHKPVRQMSLGQRTLSDILAAFLHNPKIVFLDEPTIGLDVAMKSKIRELIKTLNKEKNTTIILTTHDMGDVDALCRRIVIIDKGTILYDNDIEKIKSIFGNYRTLKVRLGKTSEELNEEAIKKEVEDMELKLKEVYPKAQTLHVSDVDEWINILVNEDEVEMIDVLNFIQRQRKIYDVRLEEISTESVIRKIYEGGLE